MSSVVKGSTVTYTASKVSAPGKDPAIVWTLDKTGMTAGADTTTMTDGVLSVDPGAAGVVIVKAQCGGKSDSVEVNILQESLADENETVTVDGGVILAEDGTVEFPESANGANPTLGEQAYVDLFYAAKLKQTVKGDFSLSFKVTDLKTVAGSSYMVSIGDRLGNLFFTPTGVSLVASYMTKTDVVNERKVNNDQTVTATFAAAEEYAVTVAVVNGFWKVTVNEQELVFQGNVLRRIEDYTAARKILIATKAGTSMKVSDIQVTDGADSKYIVLNANTEAVTDEGEIIGFESIMAPSVDGKWIGKD